MKYNILKRFFIIPLMVISLSSCLLYGNYENGTVVAYANPAVVALDWFVQAMGQLGYSFVSSESAKNASKSFSNYLQNEVDTFVNETAPALVDVAVNNLDLNISASKADMAMWNNVFNKGQTVNEAKLNSLQYKDLQTVAENSVANGSYSALTVFTRGWLTQLEKDGHLPNNYKTTSVGSQVSTQLPGKLSDCILNQFLTDESFIQRYIQYFKRIKWSIDESVLRNNIARLKNSISKKAIEQINTYGDCFYIGINCNGDIRIENLPETINSCTIYTSQTGMRFGNFAFSPSEEFYSSSCTFRSLGEELIKEPRKYMGNYSVGSLWFYTDCVNVEDWGSNYKTSFVNAPVGLHDIDIVDNGASKGNYFDIDNLGDTAVSIPIDAQKDFNLTKISDIDLNVADSIPLDIDDAQVVPKTATDVIDKVAVGDIANAVTDIDTSIDDTLSGSDTISDVVPVPEAGDYAVNLTSFFPFCIPFDIYNLLQCFNASPQAPVIHWEFTNFGKTESIDIDLSRFNSIASIMRILETIAFCVGLGLVTNKLIKH